MWNFLRQNETDRVHFRRLMARLHQHGPPNPRHALHRLQDAALSRLHRAVRAQQIRPRRSFRLLRAHRNDRRPDVHLPILRPQARRSQLRRHPQENRLRWPQRRGAGRQVSPVPGHLLRSFWSRARLISSSEFIVPTD
ncbi:hypothetical protein L596_026463 [Steinernema carpocapsae]|uniref:Uncharacterized protein n=1 Tax=Steinernema carpocapsae TaxID=34508 RepID=A0A4U5M1G6_STECR|nr:hypothetical protein L596_026463 [Steinernema carpocapsae]